MPSRVSAILSASAREVSACWRILWAMTVKPRPWTPAWAASMLAFMASRPVASAVLVMVSTMPVTACTSLCRVRSTARPRVHAPAVLHRFPVDLGDGLAHFFGLSAQFHRRLVEDAVVEGGTDGGLLLSPGEGVESAFVGRHGVEVAQHFLHGRIEPTAQVAERLQTCAGVGDGLGGLLRVSLKPALDARGFPHTRLKVGNQDAEFLHEAVEPAGQFRQLVPAFDLDGLGQVAGTAGQGSEPAADLLEGPVDDEAQYPGQQPQQEQAPEAQTDGKDHQALLGGRELGGVEVRPHHRDRTARGVGQGEEGRPERAPLVGVGPGRHHGLAAFPRLPHLFGGLFVGDEPGLPPLVFVEGAVEGVEHELPRVLPRPGPQNVEVGQAEGGHQFFQGRFGPLVGGTVEGFGGHGAHEFRIHHQRSGGTGTGEGQPHPLFAQGRRLQAAGQNGRSQQHEQASEHQEVDLENDGNFFHRTNLGVSSAGAPEQAALALALPGVRQGGPQFGALVGFLPVARAGRIRGARDLEGLHPLEQRRQGRRVGVDVETRGGQGTQKLVGGLEGGKAPLVGLALDDEPALLHRGEHQLRQVLKPGRLGEHLLGTGPRWRRGGRPRGGGRPGPRGSGRPRRRSWPPRPGTAARESSSGRR